jgi:putative ABC transport system permease protein
MVTETFAVRHALSIDDAIEVETPTGRRRLVVRGLLVPTGVARAQGGNVLIMDIQSAERSFTTPGLVNRIDVVVRSDSRPGVVRDAIMSVLPAGYRVDAPEQRRLDLHRVMQSVQTLLGAVSLLGLVAAFLIAFSRLNAVFEARVAQLAILRAVGARRGWAQRELLKESALVGTAGIALGIPLGVALAHALVPVVATATSIGAKLATAEAVVRVRPSSIVTAALMGMTAVIAAALLPARRAARVPIVETLQGRASERPSDDPISLRRLIVTVAAAAVTVVAHVVTGNAVLGLAASGIVVAAAVATSRPALHALDVPIAALARRFGVVGRFALAGLLRAPRRTALTVATIGVGFGTVLWLWTLATSFERSVVEVMPGVLRADLAVASVNVGAGYVEAPLDDGIIDEIVRVPGVRSVVGEQTADWTYAGGPIALNAFDPEYFDEASFGHWRFVGRALPDADAAVGRGDAVLVSENFVHNVGGRVGDTLTLETPEGPIEVRIAGVVADFLSPRGTVIMSRLVYRERWRNAHITHALVDLAPGVGAAQVRASIASRLGVQHQVRVLDIPELVAWFAEQARRAFASLHVLGGLVLVVVLLGVGDSLAAGVLERTRELGVVRALGARRRILGRVIIGEAIALASIGMVIAATLGTGLAVMWVKATFPALMGWTLSLHIPMAESAFVFVGAPLVCLVAAYLPARRAARLDPVLALHTE